MKVHVIDHETIHLFFDHWHFVLLERSSFDLYMDYTCADMS